MVTYAVRFMSNTPYEDVLDFKDGIIEYTHRDSDTQVRDGIIYKRVLSEPSVFCDCKEKGWGYTLPVGWIENGYFTPAIRIISLTEKGYIMNEEKASDLESIWGANYNRRHICYLFESDMMTPYEVLRYVLGHVDIEFEAAVKEDRYWRCLTDDGTSIFTDGLGYRNDRNEAHLYPIIVTNDNGVYSAAYEDEENAEFAVHTFEEFHEQFNAYQKEGMNPIVEGLSFY